MSTTKQKKYTNEWLFDHIVGVLKEKNLLPDTLDYYLAEKYPIKELANYEWDTIGWLNFGCEGIYLDMYAVGSVTTQNAQEKIHLGTFKTLGESREAMYVMAKLQADFVWETKEFVNSHLDEFTWFGYDVRFYKDGVQTFIFTRSSSEKPKDDVLRKYSAGKDYAIIRDNATRKETRVDFTTEKGEHND